MQKKEYLKQGRKVSIFYSFKTKICVWPQPQVNFLFVVSNTKKFIFFYCTGGKSRVSKKSQATAFILQYMQSSCELGPVPSVDGTPLYFLPYANVTRFYEEYNMRFVLSLPFLFDFPFLTSITTLSDVRSNTKTSTDGSTHWHVNASAFRLLLMLLKD